MRKPQPMHSRPRVKLQHLLLLFPLWLAGCHSAFIQATITNQTSQPIQIFELDYPSASFGGQNLAPNGVFRYRFKVIGQGPAKLTWTTGTGQDRSSQGPALHEDQEGTLSVAIRPQDAAWNTNLHP